MKLSELIEYMQQCMEEHGDLVVAGEQYETLFPAEQLIVERASIEDGIEEGTLVARIY